MKKYILGLLFCFCVSSVDAAWYYYRTNVSANAAGTIVLTNKNTATAIIKHIRYASYTATNSSQCIVRSVHSTFTNQVANIQISCSITNGVISPDNTFYILPGDKWIFTGLSNNVNFDLAFGMETP